MTVDNDFTEKKVPPSERESAFWVFGVLLGFIIVVGVMSVGGGMAGSLNLEDLLKSVVIGNIILGCFAAVAGYVGAETGQSFNSLLQDAFPNWTSKIASLYVPLVLICWYSIEAGIFGHFVASSLGLGSLVERILIFISAFIFAASAYFGFKWLRYVSSILVPIMILAGLYAIYIALENNNLTFGFSDESMSLTTAISLVIGTWIMGALTVVPDLTRFVRNSYIGSLVGFMGIFIGNVFTILVGASGAALTGQSDPAKILISLGMLWVAVLFGVANIWTTNDNNMYSASLHVSQILNLSRRKSVLVCTSLAAILAVFHPYRISILFTFLEILGNTAPALGGVVFGRYFLFKNDYIDSHGVLGSWFGWVFGSILNIYILGVHSYFIGFFAGAFIFYVFIRVKSIYILNN